MSADDAAVLLILMAAPAQTVFPFLYGFTSPWHQSLIGRALMTKAVGLALLIDISLIYQWLGDNYALRDVVRLTVFAIITIGAWMQLVAFVMVKRKDNRPDAVE
jgi:hypothetical protein